LVLSQSFKILEQSKATSTNAVSHTPSQFQFERCLQQLKNVALLSKQCFLWLWMSARKLKFWSIYRPCLL